MALEDKQRQCLGKTAQKGRTDSLDGWSTRRNVEWCGEDPPSFILLTMVKRRGEGKKESFGRKVVEDSRGKAMWHWATCKPKVLYHGECLTEQDIKSRNKSPNKHLNTSALSNNRRDKAPAKAYSKQ